MGRNVTGTPSYRPVLILAVLFLASAQAVTADLLSFYYEQGDRYRILSTVDQDVYVNGLFSHHAQILNRISVEVTAVEDGRGYHVSEIVTSQESVGAGSEVFAWGEQYESEYWRDPQGFYEIGPQYFMPVVRDVPLFPDREVQAGDTWSGTGQEVHDFRLGFGIPDPYRFPIPVSYEFLDTVTRDGREYARIRVNYNVFYRPDRTYPGAIHPVRITGFSNQLLFFDLAAGRLQEYEEEYALIFLLSNGDEVAFEGSAEARVVEASRMDRARIAEEVRQDLNELGFEDQDVVEDDRGVTIRLDNILFPPDSAFLRDSEKRKLETIAQILLRYPDRGILVGGHTALAGTEAGRLQLSQQRAAAVANYLLELGVRERDDIILRGFGATEPVDSNTTEEGRRRNRRVELTILEN